MKKQTPLRKAIAEIEKMRERLAPKIDEKDIESLVPWKLGKFEGINHALIVLANLLPEERRVIEEVYGKGSDDMGNSEFGGKPEHLDGNDFFISNFEQ